MAPSLPDDWEHAEIARDFRGARYRVRIERGGERGVTLAGKRIEGAVLPPLPEGSEADVRVGI